MHLSLGLRLYWAGRLEEAVAAIRKSLELNTDPKFMQVHWTLCLVLLAQGRPEEALAEAEHEADIRSRVVGLALAYHALGRKKEEDASLAETVGKYHQGEEFQIAEIYAFRGRPTRRSSGWIGPTPNGTAASPKLKATRC